MKKIILTGGGTAGHVTPNIALLPKLKKEGYQIYYIGSKNGMEKELIESCGIPYHGISSGKLRRYLDFQNVKDIVNVVKGVSEAYKLIKKIDPDVIFSKGGFIIVPVVLAAKLCGKPVVLHESDITPGLANKISIPFARDICVSFPETLQYVSKEKGVLTGTPIRAELFFGNRNEGLRICGFNHNKPVLLVMGGSSGSTKINACVRAGLCKLTKSYQIVHICGKGNIDASIDRQGYKQFEYLSGGLSDVMAAADIVVSRAGANSIYEFLALKKPCLLIPLSKNASRGDQILNAESFQKQGFSKILYEENMNKESLITEVIDLYANREVYISKMDASGLTNGIDDVINVIKKY